MLALPCETPERDVLAAAPVGGLPALLGDFWLAMDADGGLCRDLSGFDSALLWS